MIATVLIDNREKRPLPFPRTYTYYPPSKKPIGVEVVTVSRKLLTGDYILAEAPTATCIERKANLTELFSNLLNHRGRQLFIRELNRMQAFTHRVLLLEGTPRELSLIHPRVPNPPPAAAVRDSLVDLLLTYNVHLLTLPTAAPAQRRAAGEWALSLLLRGLTPCTPPSPSNPPATPPASTTK